MKCSSKILSQTVTQLCIAKEIDHIVISPGSRNAPLTIGFTEQPYFTNFSIVDERCAAFFALGLAQQLKKPVALVCTSGSAMLNYYPAIAEAFYSDIPLVVLSADRPAHLIDIGDGQTIRQENVFANHILYNANCKEGIDHQESNELLINVALNTALEQQGPVHINLPFSEPLYETLETVLVIPEHLPSKNIHDVITEDLSSFLSYWNSSARKMILVGVLPPNALSKKIINILGNDESVMVCTETTSNLHHEHFFPAIDQLIAPLDQEQFKFLQPEILVTFGGMVVSKKIKAFLRNFPPEKHYHIDGKRAMNTYFKLARHFVTHPNSFFSRLTPDIKIVRSDYRRDWLKVRNHRLERHFIYEEEIPFSDFKVFSTLFQRLPKFSHLQLANSATIRYAQLFDLDSSWEVFCNRGTSGIDGSTSTAIGASLGNSLPTILITGDLSFFYDSNALWNMYIPKNFRVIIINNSGGGIFRILQGANNSENFHTYFETKHTHTAKHLAAMYHFEYNVANDEASLHRQLQSFFDTSDAPRILEVFTPSEVNDVVLLEYFNFIR